MSYRFIPGIASQSLGNPQHHGIYKKLQAAASCGMRSVEIFFEDIEQLAQAFEADQNVIDPKFQIPLTQQQYRHLKPHQHILLQCASQIRQWCFESYPNAPSLDIICLQPFMHFEGLIDRAERASRFEKLHFWIQVAQHLGTTLIQIPSNFLPAWQITCDRSTIVADLREAAQIGAAQTPPIRFAHEALCWGTHTDTWDAAWDIVKAVDMPNFGTCLDTFNLAGRVYADPTNQLGVNQDAEVAISESIQKLRQTFSDPENLAKVFYVELCDGEVLSEPISPQHAWYDPEQPARMTWSRNARLFPFETDRKEAAAQGRNVGYLPVTEIFDALLEVDYEGYISFEVFNRSLNQPEPTVITHHAARAQESWRRCAEYIDHKLSSLSQVQRESVNSSPFPTGSPSSETIIYSSIQPRL